MAVGGRVEKKRGTSRGSQFEQLAAAVAVGESIAGAAKRLGIAERSAYRWAAEAGFKDRVRALRDETVRRTSDRLAGLGLVAAGTLQKLLASKDERIQLRAAHVVIRNAIAMADHAELKERLASIEERLSHHEQQAKQQA